jgi:hypothetical protein
VPSAEDSRLTRPRHRLRRGRIPDSGRSPKRRLPFSSRLPTVASFPLPAPTNSDTPAPSDGTACCHDGGLGSRQLPYACRCRSACQCAIAALGGVGTEGVERAAPRHLHLRRSGISCEFERPRHRLRRGSRCPPRDDPRSVGCPSRQPSRRSRASRVQRQRRATWASSARGCVAILRSPVSARARRGST